tara:strand:+ start:291 stop:638 length:348 start_codon:yes stop_codon:yes gene_type:complete
MARKSMKKKSNNNNSNNNNSNNNNSNNTSMKKRKPARSKNSSKKKKSTGKKGGKFGVVDLNNLDNNKFWCMMCSRKDKKKGTVQGKGVELVTTTNGKKALRGKCAACGCKVFRFC